MGRSFRFLRTLGSGAFGEVLLAEISTDEDFVQTLAVKWLHARHTDDPELARRLRDEARLLGLLHHPNVVRVQGLTRIDNRLAVLMEPVDGCDLSDLRLPPRAAAQVVGAVADALEAAWETVPPGRTAPLRVVHRDIKPSNVMVTPRGLVKVMDFGVARATFEAREAQTRSQQYGTARYMAPERWLEGIAEAPSDVFSLGVTLIELAGGEPVARPRLSREGFDADLADALTRLDPWPDLRALAADMVQFEAALRPTAHDVRDRAFALDLPGEDLRTWAGALEIADPGPGPLTGTVVVEDTNADTFALGDPTTGRTRTLTGTTAHTEAVVLAPADAPVAVPPEPRPRRALWAAAALGGVVALLLAAWTLAPDPSPTVLPPPAPTPVPSATVLGQDRPVREETEAPVEVAPAPAPIPVGRPVTRPAPSPAPPPDPEPAPVVPRVAVTFLLDPGITADTPYGHIDRPRQTELLPADTLVSLQVRHPQGSFGCTIPVGSTPATYHVSVQRRCEREG